MSITIRLYLCGYVLCACRALIGETHMLVHSEDIMGRFTVEPAEPSVACVPYQSDDSGHASNVRPFIVRCVAVCVRVCVCVCC